MTKPELPERDRLITVPMLMTVEQAQWITEHYRPKINAASVADCGISLVDFVRRSLTGKSPKGQHEPPTWWIVRQALGSSFHEVNGRTVPLALGAVELAQRAGVHSVSIRQGILPALFTFGHIYEAGPVKVANTKRYSIGWALTPLGMRRWAEDKNDPVERAGILTWLAELAQQRHFPAELNEGELARIAEGL